MKNETMSLVFGVFMIAMGYEIISTDHLIFRGVDLSYGDKLKFVGPLFVVIGCIAIIFSIAIYLINKRKSRP